MRKKVQLKLEICAVLTVLIFSSVYRSYAYFTNQSQKIFDLSTVINEDHSILVEDFYDLFKYTKAEIYNDANIVSPSDERITLVLQNDIVLEDDLYVTKDIHINLNGHTMNLADHSLVFQHGYAGSMVLEKGTIEHTGNGELVIDTPHASYVFNDVIYDDSIVQVKIMDPLLTGYNALYFMTNALVNHTEQREHRLTYVSLQNKDSITLDDLLRVKQNCLFAEEEHRCVFVNHDLDLPYHYFSEDIQIEYTSSNPEIINNYGNLVSLPATSVDVNLMATVSNGDWSYSVTFPVHVVNMEDEETARKVGETLLYQRLQNYWIEDGNMVRYAGVDLFDDYYFFSSGIDLPMEDNDFDLNYSYVVKDYQNRMEVETISSVAESVYRFEPNERCFHLDTTITDGNGNTTEVDLPIYCTYITNAETMVRLMMNDLYGGSIIYDASLPAKHLFTTEEILDRDDLPEYFDEFVGISYQLIGDVDDHYNFDSSTSNLTVADAIENRKESGVTVTVEFKNGSQMSIDMYVVYLTNTGDTVSGYWPYYNEYHENYVPAVLNKSFTMPFAAGSDGNFGTPYTVYDIAYDYKYGSMILDGLETGIYYSGDSITDPLIHSKPDGLTVSLVEDSTTYVTLRYGGYSTDGGNSWNAVGDSSSLTASFNAYLAASGRSLRSLKNAVWKFSINAEAITLEDTDLLLLYNYTFMDNGGSTTWLPYVVINGDKNYYSNLTVSPLTMEGGLIWASGNTANHVPDANLFIWIYNNTNPNRETISPTEDLSPYYIQNDWLKENAVLDHPANVTNYYGIQYLDNVSEVNLSGVTINQQTLSYITDMEAVAVLNLSNCGLNERIVNNGFTLLTNLKELNITSNNFELFETVFEDVKELNTVYLYDNPAAGIYRGSDGLSNYQVYEDLQNLGVAVYYSTNINGIPILFKNANERNDYTRLKNIEYQSVLAKGQDITVLYEDLQNLSTNQLRVTGTSLAWNYEPGKTAGDATYFYVVLTNGAESLKVKYYVDRY